MVESKYIVMSVKPKWAKLIMSGEKKVELRKSFSKSVLQGSTVIIYASAPTSAIIGTVKLKEIDVNKLEVLWDKYAIGAMATREEFFDYFKGKETGVALVVGQPIKQYEKSLIDLRKNYNFTPPVSWRYLKEAEIELIHKGK